MLIDLDELTAALEGRHVPHAVAEAIRAARPVAQILTYSIVRETFVEKLSRSGSMDEALMKVAWTAYNHGLRDATTNKENSK